CALPIFQTGESRKSAAGRDYAELVRVRRWKGTEDLMPRTTEPASLTSASFEELTRELLVRLGEDPEREGLVRTPDRMAKALQYLTKGYKEDPKDILNDALFTENYDEMVIVKDVEMFSMCEHHVLPFYGKVHVAYVPNGKVIGLSKVPRLI